jgi:RNA polymerase sigma-70 factor (ECF subfamily)
MTDDDMTLLQRWRGGDLQAGDALIRRHYRYALGIARKRLVRDDDAVEATQHAMTVVVQRRDEIDTDFRKYLSKVVYFSVLTQTKRHAHDPLGRDEGGGAATPARGAATAVAQKEEEKLVVKALRSLSIDDQLVFYYDCVGDKTRGELAELLGVSEKQIYKRVHRAKERLRERLESYRDSPARQSTLGGLETWLASVHRKAPVDGAR